MIVPGITFRGPLKSSPREDPVRAPARTEARVVSEVVGGETGRRGRPRVVWYQFCRAVGERIAERSVQKVLPMAKHWAPEKREKRMGVRVLRVP
jgi:hypothetical protein